MRRKTSETLDFPEKDERAAPCGAAAKFSGANGDRTHDLSRVRRTLIPAELWLHVLSLRKHPFRRTKLSISHFSCVCKP